MPVVSPPKIYIPPAASPPTLSSTKKILLIAGAIFCVLALSLFIYQNIEITSGNDPSKNSDTIDHLIFKKNYDKIIKHIQNNPNIDNRKCLEFALVSGNDAIANLFAEKINDVNAAIKNKPILAKALEKGFDKTAYTLIQRGAKTAVNGGHRNDKPLIHIAIEKRLAKTLSELIKDSKCHNALYENQSPLQYAISQSNDDIAAALVSAGAECHPAKPGNTPIIHLAIKKKLLKTLSVLAKDSKHRETVDWNNTPLQLAVHESFDEAAATLIKAGADCSKNFGTIAMDWRSIHRVTRESKTPMPITTKALKEKNISMPMEDYFYFKETTQIDWKSLSEKDKNICLELSLDKEMFSLAIESLNHGANQKKPKKPPVFVAIEKNDKALFDACLANNLDLSMTFSRAEPADGEAAVFGVSRKKAYTPLQYANHYGRDSFASRLAKKV